MLRNRSCPAVSQSCNRTRIPSTYTFFVTKNAPVVDVVFLGSNLFWVYRCNRLVLPTPGTGRQDREMISSLMKSSVSGRQSQDKDMSGRACIAHYYDLRVDTLLIPGLDIRVHARVFLHLVLSNAGSKDGAEPAEAVKKKKVRKVRDTSLVNLKQNQDRTIHSRR